MRLLQRVDAVERLALLALARDTLLLKAPLRLARRGRSLGDGGEPLLELVRAVFDILLLADERKQVLLEARAVDGRHHPRR